jgi:hypothetical protein
MPNPSGSAPRQRGPQVQILPLRSALSRLTAEIRHNLRHNLFLGSESTLEHDEMDRVADGALGIGDHRPADVADLFGRQPAPEPGWGSIFTEADVRLAALIIKTFDQ